LKKKPKFGGTYSTTSSSMLMARRIPHKQKKELSFALEVTNVCVEQWNVKYQSLTKNPN
jgi:hypothetical protein